MSQHSRVSRFATPHMCISPPCLSSNSQVSSTVIHSRFGLATLQVGLSIFELSRSHYRTFNLKIPKRLHHPFDFKMQLLPAGYWSLSGRLLASRCFASRLSASRFLSAALDNDLALHADQYTYLTIDVHNTYFSRLQYS
jgi:hypothetical protein